MGDLIRYIRGLFGVRYVLLIASGGEMKVRPVKWMGGKPYASWLGYGIRDVFLLDNGRLGNGAYVDSWEPYKPFAKRQWPAPFEAA